MEFLKREDYNISEASFAALGGSPSLQCRNGDGSFTTVPKFIALYHGTKNEQGLWYRGKPALFPRLVHEDFGEGGIFHGHIKVTAAPHKPVVYMAEKHGVRMETSYQNRSRDGKQTRERSMNRACPTCHVVMRECDAQQIKRHLTTNKFCVPCTGFAAIEARCIICAKTEDLLPVNTHSFLYLFLL